VTNSPPLVPLLTKEGIKGVVAGFSMTKLYNLSRLKKKRKYLRNNSTKAEVLLWKQLSGSKLNGLKFRRQHSIGHYILDFCCPEKRVGIELDGSVHGSDERRRYDEERQRFIEACNIKVLRFYNCQVMNNIKGVITSIVTSCEKCQRIKA
jgi:very-short-patch-repair endonuclease